MLHREALDQVPAGFALDAVPEGDRADFNLVWHRLAPWRTRSRAGGCSSVASSSRRTPTATSRWVLNLSKRAGLPWDGILGSEIARAYKPAPEAYLRNVEAIGLSPPEAMMVAAHNDDLAAACGSGRLRPATDRAPPRADQRPAPGPRCGAGRE